MQESQQGYCSTAIRRPWDGAVVERRGNEDSSGLWGSQQQGEIKRAW